MNKSVIVAIFLAAIVVSMVASTMTAANDVFAKKQKESNNKNDGKDGTPDDGNAGRGNDIVGCGADSTGCA